MKASIVVLLLLLVTVIPFEGTGPDQVVAQSRLREAGYVSLVVNTEVPKVIDDSESGPNEDVNKCPCKGTGRIRMPDGNYSQCPYHGSSRNVGEQVSDAFLDANPTDSEMIQAFYGAISKALAEAQENGSTEVVTPTVEVEDEPIEVEVVEESVTDAEEEPEAEVENEEKVVPVGMAAPEEEPVTRTVVEVEDLEEPVIVIDQQPVTVKTVQMIFFTMANCKFCDNFKDNVIPRLREMGLVVSESADADVRIVNVSTNWELWKSYERELFPTDKGKVPVYYFTVDGQKQTYMKGVPSAAIIKQKFDSLGG